MIDNKKYTEQEDSVKKRYIITLFVNIFKAVSGIIASTIVPRALGPIRYGNYQFINNIASSFRELTNMGASKAFFTYSSKIKNSGLIFKAYSLFLVIQLVILLTFIILSKSISIQHIIWPGQDINYIILITISEWIYFTAHSLIQLGESKAETVIVQRVNLVAQIFKIILIIFLYLAENLNLLSYILVFISTYIITIIGVYFFLIVKKREQYFINNRSESLLSIKNYFFSYCKPLIILSVCTFGGTFFNRWLLQYISGSVEQAYFSISHQWNTISLLFTTSILNIFWREISFSFGKNDINRMKTFFPNTIKGIYFISAVLAFYMAFNAKFLLANFAGEKFSGARNTMIILAFYPIHQTIGQLSSSFFLATEQTKLYKNLGIFSLVLGIIGAYFVLAPKTYPIPGLGLDSIGLAVNLVALQLIFTNIYLYKIAKYLELRFINFISIQIRPIILLFLIAFLCFKGLNNINYSHTYVKFVFTSMLYFLLTGLLLYKKPEIIGFNNNQIKSIVIRVRNRIIMK